MLDNQFDACRRNDSEREQSLVTADPTLLTRQAATGETPLCADHRRTARITVAKKPFHAALAAKHEDLEPFLNHSAQVVT
jgi:hypothetical protein